MHNFVQTEIRFFWMEASWICLNHGQGVGQKELLFYEERLDKDVLLFSLKPTSSFYCLWKCIHRELIEAEFELVSGVVWLLNPFRTGLFYNLLRPGEFPLLLVPCQGTIETIKMEDRIGSDQWNGMALFEESIWA